jgi:hypothetical protein
MFSIQSYVYAPPRPLPICTSQGQTALGGASIVIARVANMSGFGIRSSPGISRLTSSGVAPQVTHQSRSRSR